MRHQQQEWRPTLELGPLPRALWTLLIAIQPLQQSDNGWNGCAHRMWDATTNPALSRESPHTHHDVWRSIVDMRTPISEEAHQQSMIFTSFVAPPLPSREVLSFLGGCCDCCCLRSSIAKRRRARSREHFFETSISDVSVERKTTLLRVLTCYKPVLASMWPERYFNTRNLLARHVILVPAFCKHLWSPEHECSEFLLQCMQHFDILPQASKQETFGTHRVLSIASSLIQMLCYHRHVIFKIFMFAWYYIMQYCTALAGVVVASSK